MIDLKTTRARIVPIALLTAFTLQSAGPLCLPVMAEESRPTGTLLIPLTPKIDTRIGTESGSESGSESERSAEPAEPAEAGSEPEGSGSPELKPSPRTFDVEIEDDEVMDDEQGLASEIDEGTTLKGTIQIVADDTEYDSENNTFLGTGNAVCIIGGQNSKLEADMILYDQKNETIDARGHVTIIRDGEVTTGKSFKFKVGKDEYLITSPDTEINGATIIARTGEGSNEGLAFKTGTLKLPEPVYFGKNPFFGPISHWESAMQHRQNPAAYLPSKQVVKFKARKMVYEKYKEEGNLTVFGGKMMIGKFGIPTGKMIATITKEGNNVILPVAPSIGNNLQIGGTHIGPRFTSLFGKKGTIAWSPMIQIGGRDLNGNSSGGLGLSGQASINTPRLQANIAGGSVNKLLVADLRYRINNTAQFAGGINRFMDDGLYGFRRARVAAEVVDRRIFDKVPYMSFVGLRSSAGFYQDNPQLVNLSPGYASLFGGTQTSTVMNSAFKAQVQLTGSTHPLFALGDEKFGVKSYLFGGVAARGYSSGDASLLGQVSPVFDVYLNRARFQVGYAQSMARGNSPFVFDQFIQGSRSVNLQGDVKVNKYLTLGGGLGYNLQNKLFYSKMLTAAIGPEDFKVLLSREMVTGINRVGFDIIYGAPVGFNKLVLKQNPDHGNLGGI